MLRVCRLRGLSRFFQNLIDRHESALVKSTVKSHRARLTARHKWLTKVEGLNEIDIMHRYFSYYGDICLDPVGGAEPPVVNGLFLHAEHHSPESVGAMNPDLFCELMVTWVNFFRTCHNTMHEAAVVTEEMHDEARGCWEIIEATFSSDRHGERAEVIRARLQDKNLFAGPRFRDVYGSPKYPITPRNGYHFPRCPTYNAVCRESLVGKVLGLPRLWRGLAYFVKSCRMQELVYAACTAKDRASTQRMESPLFQAALLEEMFLF
ncbi:hypothetical protein LTR95_012980 [Oleoguttula sp. CCFEE 5521]